MFSGSPINLMLSDIWHFLYLNQKDPSLVRVSSLFFNCNYLPAASVGTLHLHYLRNNYFHLMVDRPESNFTVQVYGSRGKEWQLRMPVSKSLQTSRKGRRWEASIWHDKNIQDLTKCLTWKQFLALKRCRGLVFIL